MLPRLLAWLFCVYASLAVLLLAPLVPPFENPDEFNHTHRAEQIASGQWLARRYAGASTSGGLVALDVNRTDDVIGIIRFHADRKVTRAMLDQANSIGWHPPTNITFFNTSIYPPFFYIPSAIGIAAGKALHMSVARSLILARMLNGLCCIILAATAIAASGPLAALLFSVLCLPMSLSLFAALSQDGLMLAASTMTMAMAWQVRHSDKRLPRRLPVVMLGLCLALVAMARPAYLPFTVLPLLLPELPLRHRLSACAVIVASVLAWMELTAHYTLINGAAYRGVDPQAQFWFLIEHPQRWGAIARGTFERQGATGYSFFREFVGVLGWSDVVLPTPFYAVAGSVLACSLLLTMAADRPLLTARGQGVMFLAAITAVALMFLLVYLTWTSLRAPFVDGVQGRYFLPIALFLPAFLPVLREGRYLHLVGRCLLPPVMAFPVISVAAAVYGVVHRYYL